jgi:hypothetical protein
MCRGKGVKRAQAFLQILPICASRPAAELFCSNFQTATLVVKTRFRVVSGNYTPTLNCEMAMEKKLPASYKRCDDRHRPRMSWMWRHNSRRLCTLYSLVAFQLTRTELSAITAPLAVKILLNAS